MSDSQNKQIRQHLERGLSITPIDALLHYGCFRLSARIHDLRDEGMNIETEMVYKDKKKYASYKLKK